MELWQGRCVRDLVLFFLGMERLFFRHSYQLSSNLVLLMKIDLVFRKENEKHLVYYGSLY